nr:hypothetical protein [Segatella maculosa]
MNEMFWYAYKGDAHWGTGGNEIYAVGGHLQYINGVWLKKKSKIMADEHITEAQMKSGYPKVSPHDWRTSTGAWPMRTEPSKSPVPNHTDYFFLPALGSYDGSSFYSISEDGMYWSSSSHPQNNNSAYILDFIKGYIAVGYSSARSYGFSVGAFK